MSLRGALNYLQRALFRKDERMLKPGDPAPDFVASDHLGKPIKMSDFLGKKVVFWFFPKANTPGWTAEGTGFRDLYDQYKQKNTEVVGCSFDPPAASRAFAEKFRLPIRLVSDTSHQVGLLYGACQKDTDEYARRIAYLIDEKGIIKEAHSKVDPAKFPAEQLGRL